MRLFYFKEKPTTPLQHGSKNIKGSLSGLRQFFITETPSKMMTLSRLFDHVEKTARLER